MSDLRKLDEEIALLRGWFTTDLGTWTEAASEPDAIKDAWLDIVMAGREQTTPPFSRGGALTWALFEEWLDDNELDDLCGEMYRRGDATPGEVVARAWVEWERGKA